MNTYELKAYGRCPDNMDRDAYKVVVTSDRMLNVTDIISAVTEATDTPKYQEEITREVASELKARVTITGWHQGVLVTSEAG